MIKKRVKFTFPQKLITEPLIYQLGKKYQIVTNIRRADVREDMGWVVLELQGAEDEISDSLKWVAEYTKKWPWRFVYLEGTDICYNVSENRDRCERTLEAADPSNTIKKVRDLKTVGARAIERPHHEVSYQNYDAEVTKTLASNTMAANIRHRAGQSKGLCIPDVNSGTKSATKSATKISRFSYGFAFFSRFIFFFLFFVVFVDFGNECSYNYR